MRTLFLHLTLAIVVYIPLLANASVDSTNQTRYVIKAVRISGHIKLDGMLSDPHWKLAPGVTLDYEVQPGNDLPAKQKTTVLMLYDTASLYLAFICHDTDPSQIRAHVTDRDNIFDDDFVGIILDTYTDHQKAYEFFVNPYGIQGDLMRTGNNEDANFDVVWYSAGAVNDSGYIVEMALPFKSLRFPALKVQNWSLDLLRNLPRESRYQYSWVKLNLNDPCLLCQGGILEGLEGLQSTANVELLPYVMGFKSDNINDNTDPTSGFTNGNVQGRVGLGLKYSPNPSLGIEGVANPDFSQVESDATQISVNTTSAIFYAEKRPFFMEGNDLLTTSIQSYYSRMISNPLGAAKVIERNGNLSFAYLGAEDRNSPFIIAAEEGSVSDNNGNTTISSSHRSFSNIIRAKYDFGTQSFLGVLGTARDLIDAHNYVVGPDWNLFFGGNYTFDGQVLFSNTRELNDTSMISDSTHFGTTRFTKAFDGQEYDGTALLAEMRRDARTYSFRFTYRDFSPTFQAEDGYVPLNDLRTLEMEHTVQFYPNSSLMDWWGLDLDSFLHFDYTNSRKERWVVPTIFTQLKGQTQLSVNYLAVNDELFHSVNFTGVHRWNFNLYARPVSAATISLSASLGRFIYRGDATTAELGRGHSINAEIILRPTDRLSATIDYSRSRLSNIVGGNLFYDGYIGRISSIYQFNDKVFVRLIGQYDQFAKVIEIDPLFSFKLNPFTIFYAGSTHSFEKYGEEYGTKLTARQYFIKLQYLWRD